MIGASKEAEQTRNLTAEKCVADKCAFSELRSVEVSCDSKRHSKQDVVSVNTVKVSPKHSSKAPSVFLSRDACYDYKKGSHGTRPESNIVVILSIVFAIIIKLLELFEGVLTSVVDVVNRPPSFQNKRECFCSSTSSPDFFCSVR